MANHCNDPGTRGAWQLSVPNIPANGKLLVPTGGFGSSGIRGAAVIGHGFNDSSSAPTSLDSAFLTNLQNDGWVVYVWPYPEDNFYLSQLLDTQLPSTGFAQDVLNDSTFGARYLNTNMEEWDHLKWWLRNAMPKLHGSAVALPTLPLALFGFSWGGWHAIQVALNRYSDLVAWGAHDPGVVVSVFNPLLTFPYCYATQPAYSGGTTYAIGAFVTFNGFIYLNQVGSTGVAPTGTTTSNATWEYITGPITTTGADITTLQGIGNGSGGVLPFSVVGWANPDSSASSFLIKPYADTASSGYYSGLMTENGPLTEGHTWSTSADTPYYTGFFTGTTATSYAGGTTYLTGQMVTDNGFMYSSIAGSTGQAPTGSATSNAFWTYFSTPPWSSTFCVDHLCPKAF